jgi:ribosome recycling factor
MALILLKHYYLVSLSQDDARNWSDEIQKLTNQYVKRIDDSLTDKDKEVRPV